MLSRLLIPFAVAAALIPCHGFSSRSPGRDRAVHLAGLLVLPACKCLSERDGAARRDVLPLAFHVTYWDRLGWKDPFSLAATTIARSATAAGSATAPTRRKSSSTASRVTSARNRAEVGPAIDRGQGASATAARISLARMATSSRSRSAAVKGAEGYC